MTAPRQPDVLDVIEEHLPEYEVRTIAPMGEGLDNVAWLVNDEIVVRQAKVPDPDAIRREATVLGIVRAHVTLPVPQVVFADPDAGVLAYTHIPGQPLMHVPTASTADIAAELGRFLRELHRIPVEDVDSIVPRENEPLQTWLDEARESFSSVIDHIPPRYLKLVKSFLAASPPPAPDPERFTLIHNDFGAEHILVDPGTMRVTGIIDWSDIAITDPVRDLALILRDLGPEALDRALAVYGATLTSADVDCLLFHARCKLIEDLAFGLETRSTRYVDAALAHLGWTFDDRSRGSARWEKRG